MGLARPRPLLMTQQLQTTIGHPRRAPVQSLRSKRNNLKNEYEISKLHKIPTGTMQKCFPSKMLECGSYFRLDFWKYRVARTLLFPKEFPEISIWAKGGGGQP